MENNQSRHLQTQLDELLSWTLPSHNKHSGMGKSVEQTESKSNVCIIDSIAKQCHSSNERQIENSCLYNLKQKQKSNKDLVPSDFRHRLWQSRVRLDKVHQALTMDVPKHPFYNLEKDNSGLKDNHEDITDVQVYNTNQEVGIDHIKPSSCRSFVPRVHPQTNDSKKNIDVNKVKCVKLNEVNNDNIVKSSNGVKTDLVPSTFRHSVRQSGCHRELTNGEQLSQLGPVKGTAGLQKARDAKHDLTVVRREDYLQYRYCKMIKTDKSPSDKNVVRTPHDSDGKRTELMTYDRLKADKFDIEISSRKKPIVSAITATDMRLKLNDCKDTSVQNSLKLSDEIGETIEQPKRDITVKTNGTKHIDKGYIPNVGKRRRQESGTKKKDNLRKRLKHSSPVAVQCNTKDTVFNLFDMVNNVQRDTVVNSLQRGNNVTIQKRKDMGNQVGKPSDIGGDNHNKFKNKLQTDRFKCIKEIESNCDADNFPALTVKRYLRRSKVVENNHTVIDEQKTLTHDMVEIDKQVLSNVSEEISPSDSSKGNSVEDVDVTKMNVNSLEALIPLNSITAGNERKAKEDAIKKQNLTGLERRYSNVAIWSSVVSKFD